MIDSKDSVAERVKLDSLYGTDHKMCAHLSDGLSARFDSLPESTLKYTKSYIEVTMMTDNDRISANEHCEQADCNGCPLNNKPYGGFCVDVLELANNKAHGSKGTAD